MSALQRLAASCGVATEYWEMSGSHRPVPEQTVRAALEAMGVASADEAVCEASLEQRQREHWARALPPIWVVRDGDTAGPWTHHRQDAPPLAWIDLEEGGRRYDVVCRSETVRSGGPAGIVESQLLLPGGLPHGWHRLTLQPPAGDVSVCTLVVAPKRLPESPRGWGLALQLYSVRGGRSWGIGDLVDLADIGVWAATELGADFILINPLHAAAPLPPLADSPYLPTSRRFGHPLYIRPEAIPEFAYLSPAEMTSVTEGSAQVRSVNTSPELLDRNAVWEAKHKVLEAVFRVARSPARHAAFRAFRQREEPDLSAFATWCALAERHGATWDEWPPGAREEHLDPARVEFYAWLQWVFDEQLAAAQKQVRDAGMRVGVVQDLAIGVDPFGADTWNLGEVLTRGFHVGAPPDDFNQLGQDWTQPPWNPQALEEVGYRPLRDIMRWVLRHAGGLRLDHIVGLFRLFWIPPGGRPADGTYVRYNHQAILDILVLEAARAGVTLIGEDLGTVEPWVRDVLAERGILGTTVMLFERDGSSVKDPAGWRVDCLASVTVHDLPPTAEYLRGSHLELGESLGLLTQPLADARQAHDYEVQVWVDTLRAEGLLSPSSTASPQQVTEAMHRLMSRAPCKLLCLSLVDAVGERRTQNQPGTDQEYPNWRMPLCDADGRPVLVEDLGKYDQLRRLARALSR